MKKNKRTRRIFSRVLSRLAWATARRVRGDRGIEYREVTAAKRLIVEFGGEDVKPVFYGNEWHIEFTIYHEGYDHRRYYTVDASHGYVNDYCITNKSHVNELIGTSEFVRDCTLRRDFHDYQIFQQCADSILFWILTRDEYEDYWRDGSINYIPYDVSIRLWRDLRECAWSVVDEAVAFKKAVL